MQDARCRGAIIAPDFPAKRSGKRLTNHVPFRLHLGMELIGGILHNVGIYPLLMGPYSLYLYWRELRFKLPLTTSSTTSAFHISAIASVYLAPAPGGGDMVRNFLIVYGVVGTTIAGALLLSHILRRNRSDPQGDLIKFHSLGKKADVVFLLTLAVIVFVLALPFFFSIDAFFDPNERGAALITVLFGGIHRGILFTAALCGSGALLILPKLWRLPPDAQV